MNAEVRLVLDASNFARISKDKSDLARFFAVIDDIAKALDGRQHHLYIVWDRDYMDFFGPAARRKLENWNPKSRNVIAEQARAQQGTKADIVVLEWAQERPGSIVISSDVYKQYKEHKHWLLEPGRFVCGTYTQHDKRWLLMERQIYRNGPGPITKQLRKLSELLDDNYPTLRSVARKSRVQVEILVRLMNESGYSLSETSILSFDESSLASSLAHLVAQKPFSLADIAIEVGKSIVEMQEWVDVLGLEVEQVGESVFMDVANEEILLDAIRSPYSEVSVYRTIVIARSRDLQSLIKYSKTKPVKASLVAKCLTECWIKAIESESEFDFNLLLALPSDLRMDIIEYLINEKSIHVNEHAPEELFKDASLEARLLIECARVLVVKKWKYLSKTLDIAETLISEKGAIPSHIENHTSIRSLITNLSQLDFVRDLRIPKSRLKTVSDRIERVLSTSVVPDVLRYEAGQIEVLFANGIGVDRKEMDLLVADYLINAGISWIGAQHLRGWKPTDSEIEALKAGDLSPLLSFRKVVQETIRSISTIRTSGDEVVVLGLLCAASAEVGRLEDSLGDISKKLSRI
jgi:hypothetical protein